MGSASTTSYNIISYNAGLAHGAVALADERTPKIIEALRQATADVICLQEVWTDDDVEAVRRGLEQTYPHSFRERTVDTSEKTTPCGVMDAVNLDSCVSKECSPKGISAEECVAPGGPCTASYASINNSCKLCLAANTAEGWRCAIFGAQAYANAGRNGLLLLSRRPLKRARYTPFDTLLVKRGVITAEIDGHTVQCTHMSSDLAVVPYPATGRTFADWQEEHLAQLSVIEAQSKRGRCTVLLGDLNAGLAGEGLADELPFNFVKILEAGFVEPWDTPECTWCDDNPLAGGTANRQLDHILLRDCPASALTSYERVMDQPITVVSEGNTLDTRLSDHYGLKLTVSPPATTP